MRKIIFLNILYFFFLFIQSCSDELLTSGTVPPPSPTLRDLSPSWSPDGSKILYSRETASIDSITNGGINIIDTSGLNNQLLYPNTVAGQTLNWSPDGEWVVFELNELIYKMKSNGEDMTQLTTEAAESPVFSLTGEFIYYICNIGSNGGGTYIWRMKFDGTEKTRILYDQNISYMAAPDISNNGKIVYMSGNGLLLTDTSGSSNVVLYVALNTVMRPKITFDGSKILFTTQDEDGLYSIYTINSDGSNLTRLSGKFNYPAHADWSPDGSRIVYTKRMEEDFGYLWIMDSDGSNDRQLTFLK